MAKQRISDFFFGARILPTHAGPPTRQAVAMDPSDANGFWLGLPPGMEDIASIHCFVDANATDGNDIVGNLETDDGAGPPGSPSGTLVDDPTNNATGEVNVTTAVDRWYEIPLAAAVDVTGIQFLWVNLIGKAGNTGTVTIACLSDGRFQGNIYARTFNGSTWASLPYAACIVFEDSGGNYWWPQMSYPAPVGSGTDFYNFGATATKKMMGVAITPDINMTVSGLWAWIEPDANCPVRLYDTDGTTVLGTINFLEAQRESSNSYGVVGCFATEIDLVAGQTYFLMAAPESNVTDWETITGPSQAAIRAFFEGLSVTPKSATTQTPSGTGDFADHTDLAEIPWFSLVVSQVEDGAASGYPSEDDVQDGVVYGASNELTGNFEAPAQGDVRSGVGYGSDGTEFTGTLNVTGGGGDNSMPNIGPGCPLVKAR